MPKALYRSTDKSKELVNTYEYTYDQTNRLAVVIIPQRLRQQYTAKRNASMEIQQQRMPGNQPVRNGTDTTIVKFLRREGNVTEKRAMHMLSQEKYITITTIRIA